MLFCISFSSFLLVLLCCSPKPVLSPLSPQSFPSQGLLSLVWLQVAVRPWWQKVGYWTLYPSGKPSSGLSSRLRPMPTVKFQDIRMSPRSWQSYTITGSDDQWPVILCWSSSVGSALNLFSKVISLFPTKQYNYSPSYRGNWKLKKKATKQCLKVRINGSVGFTSLPMCKMTHFGRLKKLGVRGGISFYREGKEPALARLGNTDILTEQVNQAGLRINTLAVKYHGI